MPRNASRRIPHLGHVLLFLVIAFLALFPAEAFTLAAASLLHVASSVSAGMQDTRIQMAANALLYLIALPAAALAFHHLWGRSFWQGIAWNASAARRIAPRLVVSGLVLGFLLQAVESVLPMPKSLPMDQYFRTAPMVWFMTLFGTLLAPAFEEIFFRGMLLPALAIAADYLRLPRDREAHEQWRDETGLSRPALIVSSIVCSILFALIHAPQLGYTWPAVSLLAGVSLILCFVRIRTGSVAASTLLHASYNLSVFLLLFVSSGGYRHLDRV